MTLNWKPFFLFTSLLLLPGLLASPLAPFFRCHDPCPQNSVCLESDHKSLCMDTGLFSSCDFEYEGVTLCSLKKRDHNNREVTAMIIDTSLLTKCENSSECDATSECQIFKNYKQRWCMPSYPRSLSSCSVGQYLSQQGCRPCDAGCLACQGPSANDCTACSASTLFILPLSSCAASCPPSTYKVSQMCISCHSSCLSCTGSAATQCTDCKPSFFKSNSGECLASCPQGHYGDSETATCKQCNQSCDECTGPTECTRCASSKAFLFQGTCITECPPAYFSSGSICQACPPSCAKCSSSDICEECKPNYLFDPASKACLSSCPPGLYRVESQCLACSQACLTCSGALPQECLNCPANSFYIPALSKCAHTCPDSFFQNSSLRQCLECPQNCLSCSGPSTCLKCSETTVLSLGACIDTCPQQQFSLNGVCSPCTAFCLECNEQGCIRCSQVTLLQDRDKVCIDSCDPGFFKSGSLCSECDLKCATCEDQPSKCKSCKESLLLVQSSHQCVSSCPPRFFQHQDQCLPCPDNCLNCSTQLACEQCESPFLLQTASCVEACSNHFYIASPTNCLACDSTCLTCTGPAASECLSCISPLLHLSTSQGGLCLSQCPLSYYSNSTHCLPCDSSCLTCSGPSSSQCTDCAPSLYLSSSPGQCNPACPSKFYPDSSRHCQACSVQCDECTGPSSTQCSSCPDTFTFVKSERRCQNDECPLSYFNHLGSGVCLPCHESCNTCGGPESNHCLTCPYRVYYLPNTKECGACPSYYQHNSWSHCQPCHFSCESCHGINYSNCYSCRPPYLRYADSYYCTVTCSDNYYPSGLYCHRCDRNCKTCFGRQRDQCNSCHSPKLLLKNSTYCMDPPCPQGFFSDSASCIECHSSCATCDGPDPNNCLSCKEGELFSHSTHRCYEQCPPTTFSFESLCHDCHSSCATCVGSAPTNCLSCEPPLLFLPLTSECVESCPLSHFAFQSICVTCDPSCRSCEASSSHSCLSCESPLLFNPTLKTCQQQCEVGFYGSSISTCEPCHTSCETCSGASAQECLTCPSPFLINPDTKECTNQCGSSQYPEGDLCFPCDSSCSSCNGPHSNNCLSCRPPLYYLEDFQTCKNTCDLGYYLQDEFCRSCPTGCVSCSSPSQCFTCAQNYLLTQEGECLMSCPAAHFPQEGRCYSCDGSCAECNGSTPNHCLACASNFLQLDGTQRCVSECPSHTHKLASTCFACHQSCLSCSGPSQSQCLFCSSGYYPYSSLCLQCPSSVLPLRGQELAAVLQNCDGLLSSKDILKSVVDRQVGIIYANHASVSAHLPSSALEAVEKNATNILARSTVSSFSYSSQNLHFFKAKLFLDESQTFVLDKGISNGAEVTLTIPKSALKSLNYSDQPELVSAIFHKGLYDKQNFADWDCPVISLAFTRKNALDPSLSHSFQEPLQIEVKIKGALPRVKISGAYWNEGKWAKKGISTRLSQTSVFIYTSHLSAFTVIIDPHEGLLFGDEGSSLPYFYVTYWAFFIAFLVPAILFDMLAFRREAFPHHKYIQEFRSLILQDCQGNLPHQEEDSASSNEDASILRRQNKLFARLLKYALLYSLPFLSPYTYRDRQIWASARALLLITEISLIFLFSFLIYGTHIYFYRSKALTFLVFGILLGLFLLPHSLLHCLLKRRVTGLRSNALPFRPSHSSFAPQEGSRSKLLVFFFISGVFIVVLLVNVLSFTFQEVLTSHFLQLSLLTLVSFFFGGFLGVVKIFLGVSLIANQQQQATPYSSRPRNLGVFLFVDYMSLRVYQDFEGQSGKLHTTEFGKTTKPQQKDTERIAPLFKEMYLKTQRLTVECNQEQRVESSDKSDQSFFPASSKCSSAKIVVHSTFQRRNQGFKKN